MAKKPVARAKTIIGWREWCQLKALNLPPMAAKIDTGAKTSSLHAYRPRYFEEDGETWVEFGVHPVRKKRDPEIICRAKVKEMRSVVSSNGIAQKRPVIETMLSLGHQRFKTEFTLTNRDEMGFRMLIGRQALAKRFIVDSGLSWALGDMGECEQD